MKLSIIIPVYRVEKYIRQCIESIKNQNPDKHSTELILVNDGTPDKSMQFATEALSGISGVNIINQSNQGLSAARNAGLKVANGDYVWFVDSDDTLLPNAIQDVLAAIEIHEGIDVIATVLLEKKESTGTTTIEYYPSRNITTGKEYMFSGNRCGAAQRFIMRRQFLVENGLYFMEGVFHEDGEFGNKMPYLAKSIYILENPVYCYLLREAGSIMSSRKMKMNYDLIRIYHGLEIFCDEKVDEEDKWKYKYQMFGCLKCTILFSRKEIFSRDFETFYQEHKLLIHDKAGELLKHPKDVGLRGYMECLHFFLFPLFYTKLKTFGRRMICKFIK